MMVAPSTDVACASILKPLSDLGGTRHQSAAQFVFDQRDAFAIVASQDGRISVVSWDSERKMVSVFRHAEYLFADF
jgi:DNA integrity scanning protein DisA with diadenylate cyclase activity